MALHIEEQIDSVASLESAEIQKGADKITDPEREKAIAREQQEAAERYQDLIALVSARYETLPEKVRADFIVHNGEILNHAVELGMKENLPMEELKALEAAAVLHDITKADAPPEKYKDIPNYTLVAHGERGAEESRKILTDEKIKEYGFQGDPEAVRSMVAEAIRQHMGPHPGFMKVMLEKANAALREKGEPEISHPKAEGKVAETLLAADMGSLAGTNGRKKVMSLRSSGENYQADDRKTAEEYRAMGVELSPGEAALLSGFESAFQARDMMHDPALKEWIIAEIDRSQDERYEYGTEKIDPRTVLAKKDLYDLHVEERKRMLEAEQAEQAILKKISQL